MKCQHTLVDNQLVSIPDKVSFTERTRGLLYDYSYLYRMILGVSIVLEQNTDESLVKTDWGLILPIYRDPLHPSEEEAWQLTAALLDRMQASTTMAGATLMVIYQPEIFQVEDPLWAQVEKSNEKLSRFAPNEQLARIIPEGAQYFDLSPYLQTFAQEQELYYRSDHHFNSMGHAVVAALLEDYLLDQQLIP